MKLFKYISLCILLLFGGAGYSQNLVSNGTSIIKVGDNALSWDYDISAKIYFDSAGITDIVEKAAANRLIVSLKNTGNWDKIVGLYLMSPTSLSATAVNAKTPGTFDIVWVNTPTHTTNGVDFDGVTQYGKTGIIPSSEIEIDDVSIHYYSGDDVQEAVGIVIGSRNGNSQILILNARTDADNLRVDLFANASNVEGGNLDSKGFHSGVRASSSDLRAFKDGVQIGSAQGSPGGSLPTVEIYIGCRNNNDTPQQFTTRQCRFAMIAKGFSVAEMTILNTFVQTYQQNVIIGGRGI